MGNFAYPDLLDADFVFEALLGHGMFADKLPPCFSSEDLLEFARKNQPDIKCNNHAYVEYQSTRNTNVPRQQAVPHPESYWRLCQSIKENWPSINKHIGKAKKFNFCHVRKIKDKSHIFEMNYSGADKWQQEELVLDYALGCRYVVSADISTFFPSVYAHSIPWAVKGKKWAKKHRCTSFNKIKNEGDNCKTNNNRPCPNKSDDLWPNDLDVISRSIKDGETNGLLIGPHSSNIISEIILSQVDLALQNAGFKKVIRHIDDYEFFAKDEQEANVFLRTLVLELKKYELALNAKKTRVTPYQEFAEEYWIAKLNQFSFPSREPIGFTSINSYLEYAFSLSLNNNNFAALTYAIKVISKKSLSTRAKRLYIKKIIQIALDHPYLLPLLEKYVFHFAGNELNFLNNFLKHLINRSLQNGSTDSLAFAFYYALKYKIILDNVLWEDIIALDDCISMLLAYKYCELNLLDVDNFTQKARNLLDLPERDQDKFWLYIYEVCDVSALPSFLKQLKKANVYFIISMEGKFND